MRNNASSMMGEPYFGWDLISFLRPCAQQKASLNGSPRSRTSAPRNSYRLRIQSKASSPPSGTTPRALVIWN